MSNPPPNVNPYASAEVAPTGPNSLARASFIIAIVIVVLAIVLQFVNRLVPVIMLDLGWSSAQIGIFYAAITFVNLLLGVICLVLGILGSRSQGRTLLAGIGIGVGGLTSISSLVSIVASPLVGALYS